MIYPIAVRHCRGWSNSSRATLHGDNSTTHIVRAYLIWETRKRYNKDDNNANHVSFLMRDARTRWNIYPDWVLRTIAVRGMFLDGSSPAPEFTATLRM